MTSWWPTSWTKERAETVFRKLTGDQLTERVTRRKFFVKPNEALGKVKPRGIVAMSDELAMLQAMTIRTLGDILFSKEVCEDYSIKHANLDEQADRFARVCRRYRTGGAMSVDFGAWDSTLQWPLRKATEIAAFNAFYDRVAPRCGLVGSARGDRQRRELVADGKFWEIATTSFGRQSGDGGTSTLNFVVNWIVGLWVDERLSELAGYGEQATALFFRRLRGTSHFATIHEGDDTILLYGRQLLHKLGGACKAAEFTVDLYKSLKLRLEPAGATGVVEDPAKMILPLSERVEFVSRLWDVVGPQPFSIPKIGKAIRSASVTFSRSDIYSIAYSAGRSGMYASASHPILIEVFRFLSRYGAAHGGGWLCEGYKSREVERALSDTTLEAHMASASFNHARAADMLSREMGVPVSSIWEMASKWASCAAHPEGAWEEAARLIAQLL
jgi:hypothetical protein